MLVHKVCNPQQGFLEVICDCCACRRRQKRGKVPTRNTVSRGPIAKQKVEISADGDLALEEQEEMLECPTLSLERFSSGLHPKLIVMVENIVH